MRILGIDPGFAIVGFGVLDYNGMDFRPLEYGAITTEANTPFTQRLTAIYQDLNFILDRFQTGYGIDTSNFKVGTDAEAG